MKKYENLAERLSPAQLERMAAYLDSLPAKHKACVLGAMRGTKQVHLAQSLGISQGRVSQLIKAALAAIEEVERAV